MLRMAREPASKPASSLQEVERLHVMGSLGEEDLHLCTGQRRSTTTEGQGRNTGPSDLRPALRRAVAGGAYWSRSMAQ